MQALARVWRDGQKKDCTSLVLCSFLSASSLTLPSLIRFRLSICRCWDCRREECDSFFHPPLFLPKLISKLSRSQSSNDNLTNRTSRPASSMRKKTSDDISPETTCQTHDLFKCKRCNKETGKQMIKAPAMLYGDTTTYVQRFF